jgi:hypothetical protein
MLLALDILSLFVFIIQRFPIGIYFWLMESFLKFGKPNPWMPSDLHERKDASQAPIAHRIDRHPCHFGHLFIRQEMILIWDSAIWFSPIHSPLLKNGFLFPDRCRFFSLYFLLNSAKADLSFSSFAFLFEIQKYQNIAKWKTPLNDR